MQACMLFRVFLMFGVLWIMGVKLPRRYEQLFSLISSSRKAMSDDVFLSVTKQHENVVIAISSTLASFIKKDQPQHQQSNLI
jgi:hypothetical protein